MLLPLTLAITHFLIVSNSLPRNEGPYQGPLCSSCANAVIWWHWQKANQNFTFQSQSKLASVGCLNLLPVDFELDPNFTTLKIASLNLVYVYLTCHFCLGWHRRRQQLKLLDVHSSLPCPALGPFGWDLSIVVIPVSCSMPSTVLDLKKICLQPCQLEHDFLHVPTVFYAGYHSGGQQSHWSSRGG